MPLRHEYLCLQDLSVHYFLGHVPIGDLMHLFADCRDSGGLFDSKYIYQFC